MTRTYESQVVDIPLSGGVRQESDPVLSKGLRELVNCRYEYTDAISKRDGTEQLSQRTTIARSEYTASDPGSSINAQAEALVPMGILPTGRHLILQDHVYRLDPVSNRLDGVGFSPALTARTVEVGSYSSGQAAVADNAAGDIYCVVYGQCFLDMNGGASLGVSIRLVWEIRRSDDGTVLFSGSYFPSIPASDRTVAITNPAVHWDQTNTCFHIAFVEHSGASLTAHYRVFAVGLLTGTVSSVHTIASAGSSANRTDWTQQLGQAFSVIGNLNVLFAITGGSPATIYRLAFNGSTYSQTSIATATTGASACAITIGFNSGLVIATTWYTTSFSTVRCRLHVCSQTLTGLVETLVGPTISATLTVAVSATVAEISGLEVFITLSTFTDGVQHLLYDRFSAILVNQAADPRVFLLSDTSRYVDNVSSTVSGYYGITAYACSLESPGDAFIARFEWKNGSIVRVCALIPSAKPSAEPVLVGYNHVSRIALSGRTALVPFVTRKDVTELAAGVPVVVAVTDNPFAAPSRRAQIGGVGTALHLIPGGLPALFDGLGAVELVSTGAPDLAIAGTTGGSKIGGTTYSYVCNLKITTPSGIQIRGRQSNIQVLPLATSLNAIQFAITVSSIRESSLLPGAINSVELWGTVANGSTFYKVAEYTIDSSQEPYIAGEDRVDDITRSTNEQIQIHDGATSFQPTQAPSASASWYAGQRFWLTETPDGSAWYSQIVVGREAPVFNAALRIPTTDYGEVIGVVQLDNNTVLIAERGVLSCQFDGDSPTVTPIQGPAGCSSRNSIVTSAGGAFFAGHDSLYFIDRSLGVRRVEVAREYIPDTTQIRAACYDERYNEAVFSIAGSDSQKLRNVVINDARDGFAAGMFEFTRAVGDGGYVTAFSYNHDDGRMYMLTSKSFVMREVPGSFVDVNRDGSARFWVSMSFTTPWFNPGYVQGYMRTWRAGLKFTAFPPRTIPPFGFSEDPCDVLVAVRQNHVDDVTQSRTFEGVTQAAYKDSRAMLRLKRQKCHALSIQVTDAPPDGVFESSNSGRGVRYQAVSLEIQVQGGLRRLPGAQRG
jgi:hypothetical protein